MGRRAEESASTPLTNGIEAPVQGPRCHFGQVVRSLARITSEPDLPAQTDRDCRHEHSVSRSKSQRQYKRVFGMPLAHLARRHAMAGLGVKWDVQCWTWR